MLEFRAILLFNRTYCLATAWKRDHDPVALRSAGTELDAVALTGTVPERWLARHQVLEQGGGAVSSIN